MRCRIDIVAYYSPVTLRHLGSRIEITRGYRFCPLSPTMPLNDESVAAMSANNGGSNLRKFQVLTWKTCITKLRHYIETTLDIVIPSLLFIVLVVLRYKVADFSPKTVAEQSFLNHDLINFFNRENPFGRGDWLCTCETSPKNVYFYAPLTSAVNDTMAKFQTTYEAIHNKTCSNFCGFSNPPKFRTGKNLKPN